jgi:hypothetical protein
LLFYGDIIDDDPLDYHDVEVGERIPEELAAAIEGLITSAEQVCLEMVYRARESW